MTIRPSVFDYKYDNMSAEQTALEYERDLMLWEQNQLLEQIAETNKERLEAMKEAEEEIEWNKICEASRNDIEIDKTDPIAQEIDYLTADFLKLVKKQSLWQDILFWTGLITLLSGYALFFTLFIDLKIAMITAIIFGIAYWINKGPVTRKIIILNTSIDNVLNRKDRLEAELINKAKNSKSHKTKK